MKTRHQRSARSAPSGQFAELRARLAEAEETLRAIRNGEVDTMLGTGKKNRQVFTLEGAGHAYRELIESMNEGALTLTTDKMILYANQCFAQMVKRPLEQVIGTSFREFLAVADRRPLRALLMRAGKTGSKVQLVLHAGDGSQMPVLISVRPLARQGSKIVTVGMVVTDLTEARHNEEMLRALSHRLMKVQELERGRVALELHDNITQLLCAMHVRSQTLANKLPLHQRESRREAVRLSGLLGQAAEEVERISRNLRPGVLDIMGLIPVLRSTSTEFAKRTGVSLKLTCEPVAVRLPADIELVLYRILQEALQNVHKHARARHVAVQLTQRGDFVQLTVKDDGVGFDMIDHPARRKRKSGLGLLNMRERVAYVGGVLSLQSAPGKGTILQAQVPLSTPA